MPAHLDVPLPARLPGLIDAYRTFDERVAVMIWGSSLLRASDAADVDVAVVWPEAPPDPDRRGGALRGLGAGAGDQVASATGDRILADDQMLDVAHFSYAEMEGRIAPLGRGIAASLISIPTPDPLAVAFAVQHALVASDSGGLAARLQAHIVPYPKTLRERLAAEHARLRWDVVPKLRAALRRGHLMTFELLMVMWARAALVMHFSAHGHFYPGASWLVEWATVLGIPVEPIETAHRVVDHRLSPTERLAALRDTLAFGAPETR